MQTLAQEIQKRMTYLLPAGITEQEWEVIIDQIVLLRQEALIKQAKEIMEKLPEQREDLKMFPECNWNSAIDEIKSLLSEYIA